MLEWQSEKEEQLESGRILREAVEAAVEERSAVEEELRSSLDQRRELEKLLKVRFCWMISTPREGFPLKSY